jgi:RNA polymerase sigma factor (TIGR02999 family)
MPPPSEEITQLLTEYGAGNREAVDRLLPLVYPELRRIAARYLRAERPEHTLQPTALVHEAYLKLVDQRDVTWQNRVHFYGVAAQLMRRLLVDYARAHGASKRGGDQVRVPLEEALVVPQEQALDLVRLDEALERLAELDAQQSRVVELRYFGGLSIEETAEVLGVSPATVKRNWAMAKAWLHHELVGGE